MALNSRNSYLLIHFSSYCNRNHPRNQVCFIEFVTFLTKINFSINENEEIAVNTKKRIVHILFVNLSFFIDQCTLASSVGEKPNIARNECGFFVDNPDIF